MTCPPTTAMPITGLPARPRRSRRETNDTVPELRCVVDNSTMPYGHAPWKSRTGGRVSNSRRPSDFTDFREPVPTLLPSPEPVPACGFHHSATGESSAQHPVGGGVVPESRHLFPPWRVPGFRHFLDILSRVSRSWSGSRHVSRRLGSVGPLLSSHLRGERPGLAMHPTHAPELLVLVRLKRLCRTEPSTGSSWQEFGDSVCVAGHLAEPRIGARLRVPRHRVATYTTSEPSSPGTRLRTRGGAGCSGGVSGSRRSKTPGLAMHPTHAPELDGSVRHLRRNRALERNSPSNRVPSERVPRSGNSVYCAGTIISG